MKKSLICLLALVSMGIMGGCQGSKDYSTTKIEPVGTPNPNLPVLGVAGASGPGAPASGAASGK